MYPVTGSIVIIKRLRIDAVGDDQDPAIVNSVRPAGPFRRPGYVEPKGPSNDPSRQTQPIDEGVWTGKGPLPTELPPHASLPDPRPLDENVAFSTETAIPAPMPVSAVMPDGSVQVAQPSPYGPGTYGPGQTDISERQREINRLDELPPLQPGESRPVKTGKIIELVPPDAFINATMFAEGAEPRLVRNVPFFDSKAAALAHRGEDPPRAPAGEPDKYLVAYWPNDEVDTEGESYFRVENDERVGDQPGYVKTLNK